MNKIHQIRCKVSNKILTIDTQIARSDIKLGVLTTSKSIYDVRIPREKLLLINNATKEGAFPTGKRTLFIEQDSTYATDLLYNRRFRLINRGCHHGIINEQEIDSRFEYRRSALTPITKDAFKFIKEWQQSDKYAGLNDLAELYWYLAEEVGESTFKPKADHDYKVMKRFHF